MLAKNSQAPRSFSKHALSLTFFASKLAPVGDDRLTDWHCGLPAIAAEGNHDAKRAALDLALDLKRPVKPRWPEFDRDLGGKPAGMPV